MGAKHGRETSSFAAHHFRPSSSVNDFRRGMQRADGTPLPPTKMSSEKQLNSLGNSTNTSTSSPKNSYHSYHFECARAWKDRLLTKFRRPKGKKSRSINNSSKSKNLTVPFRMVKELNNPIELDRLDQEHYFYRTLFQGLNTLVPYQEIVGENPLQPGLIKALDIFHGTGVWMLEMAGEYPMVQFYGVDDLTIHPKCIIPPNCRFYHHNILRRRLPFYDHEFNHIHHRNVLSSLPSRMLRAHYSELYRILAPDGYLECIEPDYQHLNVGPAGEMINRVLENWQEKNGIYGSKASFQELEHQLTLAGFTNVDMITLKIPTGAWGGETGRMSKEIFMAMLRGIGESLEISQKNKLFDSMALWQRELEHRESWWLLKVVIARKAPMSSSDSSTLRKG